MAPSEPFRPLCSKKFHKTLILAFQKTLILAFEANSALSHENETKIVKITHSELDYWRAYSWKTELMDCDST